MRKTTISLILTVLLAFSGCVVGIKVQSKQQITQNLEQYYSDPKNRSIEEPLSEVMEQQAKMGNAVQFIGLAMAGDKVAQTLFKDRMIAIAEDLDYVEYLLLVIRVALHENRVEEVKPLVKEIQAIHKSIIERLRVIIPEMNEYWEKKKMEKEGI